LEEEKKRVGSDPKMGYDTSSFHGQAWLLTRLGMSINFYCLLTRGAAQLIKF
jgi:hypothetical protein